MSKNMFKILKSLILVISLIPNVLAGDCGIVSHGHCVIPQKQLVTPVVTQVVTPVKKTIVVEQHKVEFDAQYFLGLNGYLDVVNDLRQKELLADRNIIQKQQDQQDKLIGVAESIVRNQELTLKQQEFMLQTIAAIVSGKPVPQVIPKELTPPSLPTPTLKPENTTPKVSDDNLDEKVFSIFKKNCSACHGYNKADAGLQLVGKEENGEEWLADLSLSERTLVHYRTAGVGLKEHGDKLMPLNGSPLNDSDVELLRQWVVNKAKADAINIKQAQKNN